jgi:ORF6N domain
MSAVPAVPALQPHIASRILALRSQRVMLDADLAELYGVETRVLIQAIKRNAVRFPVDFMFQLDADEYAALRSQFVISNVGRGGRRYAPYAFTEQGVAMLSSVLNSERAAVINIEIMRTFVRVRTLASTQQDLAKQLTELQDKTESLAMSHETFSRNTKAQLREVFETLRELMTPPPSPKRPIGFVHPQDAAKPKAKAVKASAAKKAAIAAPVKAGRKK